jgi:hypothetical protein
MIDSRSAKPARSVWSGTVQHIFRSVGLDAHSQAPEISESLAVFCEEHPRVSAQALSLLMARSFVMTGDASAADRVLRHDRTHSDYADNWLSVLSDEYPFPELFPLFAARALRPLRLHSALRQSTWLLDFSNIRLSEADRHEMILLQTVRVLTEKVSSVWKKTNGCGVLVVKGVSHLMDNDPLIRHMHAVLDRLAIQSGWSDRPMLLQMDFWPCP